MAADTRINAWDDIADTYGLAPVFAQFAEALVDLANIHPGESVLDIGTGNGLSIIPITKLNPPGFVVGADLSPKMLSVAARRLAEAQVDRVALVQMDAGSLGFVDAAFDVALASSVWQFLNCSIEVLQEWRRVLRPGGRLAFSIPGPGEGAGVPRDLMTKYFQRLPIAVQDRFRRRGSRQPVTDPGAAARQGGFATAEVHTRAWRAQVSDPETWWDGQWHHGVRGLLTELDPSALAELKEEAIGRLQRAPSGDVLVKVEVVFCLATA